jgi:hypothetical protein
MIPWSLRVDDDAAVAFDGGDEKESAPGSLKDSSRPPSAHAVLAGSSISGGDML